MGQVVIAAIAAIGQMALAQGAQFDLMLCPPPTRERLDDWASLLRLTAEQRGVFDARVETTLQPLNDVWTREFKDLETASAELASGPGPYEDQSTIEAFEAMWRRRNRVAAQLAGIEGDLFVPWSDPPLLSAEQVEDLAVLGEARRRERTLAARCEIGAAQVDLGLLLLDLVRESGGPFRGEDSLREAWRAYESELGALRDRRVTELVEAGLRDPRLYHQFPPDQMDEFVAARTTLRRAFLRSEMLIVNRSRYWLDELTRSLEPATGDKLRRTYLAQAFPRVYPDPFDCTVLAGQIEADAELPAGAKSDMRALSAACGARLGEIGRLMEQACVRYDEENAAAVTRSPTRTDGFERSLAELNRRRAACAAEFLAVADHELGDLSRWPAAGRLQEAVRNASLAQDGGAGSR
ncbi:MAG: hypothetical protein KDA22_07870 [Phycisphaerales bacterium]|nr:hypothetical protein [Phycisphaerales bacterium]